jgi:hypothetical protein
VAGALVALQLLAWAPHAGAQNFAPGEPIELRGFASGTILHVHALEMGGSRLVDSEVAFSSAVADADKDGVGAPKLNEMRRLLQGPVSGNKFSYAKGTGLEAGLAQNSPQGPDEDNDLILAGKAEQTAPPDNKDPATESIDVAGDPVAYASLVRGQALANSQDSGLIPEVCVLGDDISRGLGYAADAELVDLGSGEAGGDHLEGALAALNDQQNPRSVSQSASKTRLVPTGLPNNFGLQSEVRETIAPVTVLQTRPPGGGSGPRLLTIELAGEWFLKATALGKKGGAKVEYGTGSGPNIEDNLTSLLRILNPDGTPLAGINLEDVLGEGGLTIPGDPLVNISIAEGPRKLTAPGAFPDPDSSPEAAANGTKAVGAVDVIRVRLIAPDETTQVAEIRVGHMEVSAEVPAGGVNCPIPVVKTADPKTINISPQKPDTSKISIKVINAFDCDLEGVTLTDRIRQREGDPDFKINASDPKPKSPNLPTGTTSTADVVWELGTIKKGDSRTVTLDLQSATKGGIIRDIAEATGKLANCNGEDAAGIGIAGLNLQGFSNPLDIVIPTPVTGAGATTTAATGAALAAGALGVAGFLRRRRWRAA